MEGSGLGFKVHRLSIVVHDFCPTQGFGLDLALQDWATGPAGPLAGVAQPRKPELIFDITSSLTQQRPRQRPTKALTALEPQLSEAATATDLKEDLGGGAPPAKMFDSFMVCLILRGDDLQARPQTSKICLT